LNRFRGQVILLTGGARGLGLGMARRFAAEGGAVALADIDKVALAEAVEAVGGEGGALVTGERVDVSSSEDVDRWIDGVVKRFGRIDVLVNNAGVIRDNRVERISDEDWRTVVDVNLTATFNCIRATLPAMRDGRYGRILSLSSMSWRGNFGQANYAAAKAGIVGLTSTVALETARHGITVNAIAPGLIETPMLASMDAGARDKLVSRVPMGHTGDPADIAAAACFLCSPEAGYLTGLVLNVDGGLAVGSAAR
jgi:NAD(P)-dependent dehydrogenase (short-subunit alcohol dehydrogenase family)